MEGMKDRMEKAMKKYEPIATHLHMTQIDFQLGYLHSSKDAKKYFEEATDYLKEIDDILGICMHHFPLAPEINDLFIQILISIKPKLRGEMDQLQIFINNPPQKRDTRYDEPDDDFDATESMNILIGMKKAREKLKNIKKGEKISDSDTDSFVEDLDKEELEKEKEIKNILQNKKPMEPPKSSSEESHEPEIPQNPELQQNNIESQTSQTILEDNSNEDKMEKTAEGVDKKENEQKTENPVCTKETEEPPIQPEENGFFEEKKEEEESGILILDYGNDDEPINNDNDQETDSSDDTL